jgi:uncharacterized protein (TIGR03435 family)
VRVCAIALLVACAANGQTGTKLEFDAATIKQSAAPDGGMRRVGCTGGPGQPDPVMFRCTNMSLKNLLVRASGMESFQVAGPDWMPSQMFEIAAKVPDGATKEQFAEMLQNMLIDRFGLKTHHESREITRYELVVAKGGLKLKEASETPASAPPPGPGRAGKIEFDKDGYPMLERGRPGMIMMNGRARLFNPGMTMERLAGQLSGQLGKPVADMTGLKGKYDIGLYWSAEQMRAGAPGLGPSSAAPEFDSGPTLERAIQDQLGLRLEAKKGSVDFLVVDHMEKLPTDN